MKGVSIHTYYQTAVDLQRTGKLSEARRLYLDILSVHPNHFESLFMIGQSWFQERNFDKALDYYEKCLKVQPSNAAPLLQQGRALISIRKLEEAKLVFKKLLEQDNTNPQVWFHTARNFKELGDFEGAIQAYNELLKLDPNHKQGLNNLGNLYQQVFDYSKSMKCYDILFELEGPTAMTYCNKGGLLQKMGQLDEAEKLYKSALEIAPQNPMAFYNLGLIQSSKYNHKKALDLLEQAISLTPENHKYLSTYATTLRDLGEKKQAMDLLQKLVLAGSKSEEPYLKLAKMFMSEAKKEQAVQLLESYLERNPYSYEAYYILGIAYEQLNNLERAEAALHKIEDHKEFSLRVILTLLLLYAKMGRMDRYDQLLLKVESQLRNFLQSERFEDEIPVYHLAYFPLDLNLKAEVMAKFSSSLMHRVRPLRDKLDFKYQAKKGRIKIGYLSPYFHKHPAGVLIQDILKNHDKEKFEVYAYGINCKRDEVNLEIRPMVEHYTDIGELSTEQAGTKINNDGIHILISLAGYNLGMRTEIPALKPAPVQVVCMDNHESIQGDFYDYVFKDDVVITEVNKQFFSESIIKLPPSHFFNSVLQPSKNGVTRGEFDLPEEGFVFGCLNHPRKLTPSAISAWMHILSADEDSVLWLYDAGIEVFRENVWKIASEYAIGSHRIIFCGKVGNKDHYRRMELMDLFLDTPIYNGHTTCLEALWMGVPVLTIQGESVSARLCSSFLVAVGMEQLICETTEDYVRKALHFYNNKQEVQSLKEHLIKAKGESDFFDPKVLTRRMEKAYELIWGRYERGERPSDLTIDDC